ncbi:MAG: TonB-dependent vitamin B12 receptor [Candidatus Thiodiazotropha sp.]
MKLKISLAGTSVLALCMPLHAAEQLNPIVVTATRTAETVNESLAPVTILTHEDLVRRQVQSLQDALRTTPGLTLVNNGGPGKATSVLLRGAESDHLLVLIDGIKIGSASLGTSAFQDIPVEQIERIEIVRGPRSSLYGSEAISGVIQIFTRRGGGETRADLNLDLGSAKSQGASAALSGGGDRASYSISGAYSDTDGIDACRGQPGADGGGCFTVEPDRDGYRNDSLSLQAGYRFDLPLEIELHALRSTAENEYDGVFVNESEVLQQVLSGQLRYLPEKGWGMTLSAGRSWDGLDSFKDGQFQSRFDTRRDSLSLQGDYLLQEDHQFTLGYDYEREQLDSNVEYTHTERDNRGVFVQYQGRLADQDLQLSLRRDEPQRFDAHSTGNIAWGMTWAGGVRTTVAYGTAFKAPTFNDLYYPFFGNPDLEPETSQTLEFGLSGLVLEGQWSVNLFRTDIDQMIGFDATYTPSNIDQARINGLEMVFNTRYGDWLFDSNLTLLDPRIRSAGENHNNLLPRRARRSLSLDLDRRFGRYSLGLGFIAEGRRYDDLDNQVELGGYGLLDLRGGYQMGKSWRLQGRVENLTDKSYETAAWYNQPGRSYYLSLHYGT